MTFQKQKLFIIAATALILNACGGGGDSSTATVVTPEENTTAEVNTTIPDTKVKKCAQGYSSLRKNDKITANVANTKIKIKHVQDGRKEACVDTGDAKIN